MSSSKFAIMMHDIRNLVRQKDLDFVKAHAEPLSPGDFVPVSPSFDASANKFGGRISPRVADPLVGALCVVGSLLVVCVLGVAAHRIVRACKTN